MKHGISVLPKHQPKKAKGTRSREYCSAVKVESWKFRLMNTVDQCMRYASTKEIMEHEFRIRAVLANRGIDAEERSAVYDAADLSR